MKTVITILFLFSFFSQAQLNREGKDSLNYAINLLNTGERLNDANRIVLKYIDSIESDTNKIKLNITVSSIKGAQGKYNEAIEFANKALELSLKNENLFKLEIDNLLGSIHNTIGDYKQGIFYLKKTLNRGNFMIFELITYEDIIQSYLKLNETDSAYHYANLALNKFSINKNEVSNKILYKIKVLKERSKFNNHNKIISVLKEGINNGLLEESAINYANIGLSYQELKQYDSSLTYYNKAINLSTLIQDSLKSIEIYQKMIELYDSIGDVAKKEEIIILKYQYRNFLQKIDQESYKELVLLYEKINEKNNNFFYSCVLLVIGLFIVAIFLIIKVLKFKKTKRIKESKQIHISSDVIDKIKEGLKEIKKNKDYLNLDFNMSFLENKIGINRRYIGLYLKEEKKISLTTYTNILRIQHAESRITNSNDPYRKYTIEQMATEVGYKTAVTFKKYLKEYSDVVLD